MTDSERKFKKSIPKYTLTSSESSSQIGHFGTACGINLVNAAMQLSVGHAWPSNLVGLRTALAFGPRCVGPRRSGQARETHGGATHHQALTNQNERGTQKHRTTTSTTNTNTKPNHNEALLLPCYRCRSSWHLHHDVPSHRQPSWYERHRCGCDRH